MKMSSPFICKHHQQDANRSWCNCRTVHLYKTNQNKKLYKTKSYAKPAEPLSLLPTVHKNPIKKRPSYQCVKGPAHGKENNNDEPFFVKSGKSSSRITLRYHENRSSTPSLVNLKQYTRVRNGKSSTEVLPAKKQESDHFKGCSNTKASVSMQVIPISREAKFLDKSDEFTFGSSKYVSCAKVNQLEKEFDSSIEKPFRDSKTFLTKSKSKWEPKVDIEDNEELSENLKLPKVQITNNLAIAQRPLRNQLPTPEKDSRKTPVQYIDFPGGYYPISKVNINNLVRKNHLPKFGNKRDANNVLDKFRYFMRGKCPPGHSTLSAEIYGSKEMRYILLDDQCIKLDPHCHTSMYAVYMKRGSLIDIAILKLFSNLTDVKNIFKEYALGILSNGIKGIPLTYGMVCLNRGEARKCGFQDIAIVKKFVGDHGTLQLTHIKRHLHICSKMLQVSNLFDQYNIKAAVCKLCMRVFQAMGRMAASGLGFQNIELSNIVVQLQGISNRIQPYFLYDSSQICQIKPSDPSEGNREFLKVFIPIFRNIVNLSGLDVTGNYIERLNHDIAAKKEFSEVTMRKELELLEKKFHCSAALQKRRTRACKTMVF